MSTESPTLRPIMHRTYTLDEMADAIAELGANRIPGKAIVKV